MMVKDRDSIAGLHREVTRLNKENETLEASRCPCSGSSASLRESRESYRIIVSSVQDAIYSMSTEGLITSLNPAWETITGLKRSEWMGRSFGSLVHDEDLPHVMEFFAKAVAGEASPPYEARFRTASGEYKVGHFANAPHFENGKVTAVIGVARDITDLVREREDRLQFERRMYEAQKLESLGVLAGGIAHDLNNLLVGILGNADMALRHECLHASVRTRLADVKHAAIRLSELTNQMLAYSGRGKLVVEDVDLSQTVEDMGRLLGVGIPKKATVHFDLMDEVPVIRADVVQLRQVILNLLTNAAESKANEQVVVSVKTSVFDADASFLANSVVVSDPCPGRYVLLEVSDTGDGIDDATMSKIFDPFYTTKCKGRGLGLAAVLGIVRSHGAAMRVTSTPGVGSCFQILFPFAKEQRPRKQKPCDGFTGGWRAEGLILAVDDEPAVLRVARLMLEEIGFDVLTATDGIEVLEKVKAQSAAISAVLLDVTMPRMDGLEAHHHIRELRPNLPVILSSGYSEPEVLRQLSGTPVDGYLQKPYDTTRLIDALQKVCGHCFRGLGPCTAA